MRLFSIYRTPFIKNVRTNMKYKSITLTLILLIASVSCSREGKYIRFPLHNNMLNKNQVEYNPPAGFDYVHAIGNKGKNKSFSFSGLKHPNWKHGRYQLLYGKFVSHDKNFVVWVDIPPLYVRDGDKDSIYSDERLGIKMKISTYHIGSIKSDFDYNTGVEKGIQERPLHYESSSYARKAFNADTVITYQLKVWHPYENKYNHCKVIVMQKNKRGCITLYCLYNDAGKEKLSTYMRALEGLFRYRNPEEYIKFSKKERARDSLIFFNTHIP